VYYNGGNGPFSFKILLRKENITTNYMNKSEIGIALLIFEVFYERLPW
jgi:hypothetical protein